jgi:hypothetical protein
MQSSHVVVANIGVGLGIAGYVFAVRRIFRRWGTTADEVTQPLPGDELVANPRWTMTHAVTIDAPPEVVWPWLVQIGYRRGGLYSYDRLDIWAKILDSPSAERILPEFQEIAVGDVIPLGSGPSWPVAAVEPGHSLVLSPDVSASPGTAVTWAFVLRAMAAGRTRLLTRVRAQYPRNSGTALLMPAMDVAAFLMTRKMLLGIKERAERPATLEPRETVGFTPRAVS